MQVTSSSISADLLQSLIAAARKKYQAGQNFDFDVSGQDANSASSASSASSSANSSAQGSPAISGSFQSASLVAVGTFSPDGTYNPFPKAQVDQEEAQVADYRQSTYADALQNFMTLAQIGSTGGSVGSASYSDTQSFTSSNGLVSGSFKSNFDLSA